MKIATWNVNSLRVRLPHLADFLAANPLDAIALQETKLPDPDFPVADLQTLGLTFWFAVAATAVAFAGSFVACVVCCRLPTARHEDKEYKIMQLPTYS